jgi:alpha-mannosidase
MLSTDPVAVDLQSIERLATHAKETQRRFIEEVHFAQRLCDAHPELGTVWRPLIASAVASVKTALQAGTDMHTAISQAEQIMEPIGAKAKEYTIHCVGHAHIDMNWMWSWPETVATTNDTASTVLKLMDIFPTFHFSQSQTSVYQLMKDYLPDLYAKVKQRIAEGRWEVTANHWVEGDKNLASGEILCRHLLYTKRFFQQEFGFTYDAVKIDWEPDTFGHARTLPTILAKGGVRWYYFCRGGKGPQLFWWQGKDGSRILAFDDRQSWYNGFIEPIGNEEFASNVRSLTALVFDFEKETGLKDYLFVYGVGDHGGGPTIRDVRGALERDTWPIYPHIKLSTVDAFFTIAEAQAGDLPVIDDELNFVFEGCYTSESNIKYANRTSENALVEAEMTALLGKAWAGVPYPHEGLTLGWRHAMFNQFHDILPGSGVKATYEYAQGLFQEILTQTSMAKTQALRAIASRVNTAGACVCHDNDVFPIGPGLGGGMGDMVRNGGLTSYSPGGACCDHFLAFNPTPWPRSEAMTVRLWDRDWSDEAITVTDDAGNRIPAQVIERGGYWMHKYTSIAFPVQQVPGLGYRTYTVTGTPGTTTVKEAGAKCSLRPKGPETQSVYTPTSPGSIADYGVIMENEFFTVEVEQASGAIVHLIDKRTGCDLAPAGGRIGALEYWHEAPHGMTAWVVGQITKVAPFLQGGMMEIVQSGPYLAQVRTKHTYNDSTFTLTVSLAAGVPRVDFDLEVDWLERGTPETGVPMLKVAFPLAVKAEQATFECPQGSVARPVNGLDVPALNWVDLTGQVDGINEPAGATLVNDSKYAHSVLDNTIRLTLLRSSYDPDPLPEIGKHRIRFGLAPHVGLWTVSDATRAGQAFNHLFEMVGTTTHDGDMPASQGGVELLTHNVMLSGMKQAEDSEAVMVRLYEMEGKATTAQLRLSAELVAPDSSAVETDVLEQPTAASTARMQGDILSVDLPAFGMTTVKIG